MKNPEFNPMKTTNDFSVWQMSARVGLLSTFLMAYSYCFLLTVKSILNML
jgi:hypothetical protein